MVHFFPTPAKSYTPNMIASTKKRSYTIDNVKPVAIAVVMMTYRSRTRQVGPLLGDGVYPPPSSYIDVPKLKVKGFRVVSTPLNSHSN